MLTAGEVPTYVTGSSLAQIVEVANMQVYPSYLFIEMRCTLMRFTTHVIGPSLAEIIKVEVIEPTEE